MNFNDLTSEEKKIILNNRLENLQTSLNRSGNVLNMFQMKNGDVSLSIANEEDKTAISISLGNEDCNKIYQLLKQRYEIKKQINSLNTDKELISSEEIERAEKARRQFKF